VLGDRTWGSDTVWRVSGAWHGAGCRTETLYPRGTRIGSHSERFFVVPFPAAELPLSPFPAPGSSPKQRRQGAKDAGKGVISRSLKYSPAARDRGRGRPAAYSGRRGAAKGLSRLVGVGMQTGQIQQAPLREE